MYPKVEDTSAARKSVIIKPGFIGTVRIMKNKIRGEDFPEFPASDNSPDLLNAGCKPVGEIDCKQPIC